MSYMTSMTSYFPYTISGYQHSRMLTLSRATVCVSQAFLFQYPLLSHEWVKLRTSNFVGPTHTHSISRKKAYYKFREKQPSAQSGTPENFQALGRIVRLSLRQLSFLVTSVTRALEVFVKRYARYKSTLYLLRSTYKALEVLNSK